VKKKMKNENDETMTVCDKPKIWLERGSLFKQKKTSKTRRA